MLNTKRYMYFYFKVYANGNKRYLILSTFVTSFIEILKNLNFLYICNVLKELFHLICYSKKKIQTKIFALKNLPY